MSTKMVSVNEPKEALEDNESVEILTLATVNTKESVGTLTQKKFALFIYKNKNVKRVIVAYDILKRACGLKVKVVVRCDHCTKSKKRLMYRLLITSRGCNNILEDKQCVVEHII